MTEFTSNELVIVKELLDALTCAQQKFDKYGTAVEGEVVLKYNGETIANCTVCSDGDWVLRLNENPSA